VCNAYNLEAHLALIDEELERRLSLRLVLPPGVTPATSNLPIPKEVFPRRDGLILRPADPSAPSNGLEPALAHWNLTPFFHRGALKDWKASTNNCRSESMATTPAFREAYQRRRCLIPVTSFIEWTGPKGRKTAHAISRTGGGLLFLAGLWDRCRFEGESIESYTMVMQAAEGADFMARFHHRQPVVLEAQGAAVWLDLKADPRPVIAPPPPGALTADPPEPAAA
jgi:putative SOS response-associated peptidase YedK